MSESASKLLQRFLRTLALVKDFNHKDAERIAKRNWDKVNHKERGKARHAMLMTIKTINASKAKDNTSGGGAASTHQP